MSIPRPKFCVGEVVDIISRFGNYYGVEVLAVRWFSGRIIQLDGSCVDYTGFLYSTNAETGHERTEKVLRKRPQNNWENSVWKPEEVTA